MDVKMRGIRLGTADRIDRALARDLEYRCYGLHQNVQRGKALVHGMLHINPGLKVRIPLAMKALVGWDRVHVAGEGRPMSQAAVFLVVRHLFAEGRLFEAIAVWLSWDCYLRESDWESLRLEDIFVYGKSMSTKAPAVGLRLGAAHRGLSTKTGPEQTVVVDDTFLRRVLAAIRETGHPDDPLFPFKQQHYRVMWHRVLAFLGLPPLPPHSLRHSRPSHQISTGELSLEEVRRRGRWRQLKSVQRYTKAALIIAYNSQLPQKVLTAGGRVLENPVRAFQDAAASGRGRKTSVGQILLAAARQELSGSKLGCRDGSAPSASSDGRQA
jgi:hypothetical protein